MNYGDQQKPSKLHAHWRGPFRVVKIDEEDLSRYTVQNLVTNKLEDFPVHQLKPFLENGVDTPHDVAMHDDAKLHNVERILSHEGSRTKPSSLRFLVKWDDEANPSLETYSSIKSTAILHEYLTELGDECGAWSSSKFVQWCHPP